MKGKIKRKEEKSKRKEYDTRNQAAWGDRQESRKKERKKESK